MNARLCAVSVDLDGIACYHRIHGLEPPEGTLDPVMSRALPRFLELFQERGIRATFFVVGESLRSEGGRKAVATLCGSGHEIGNHTLTHPYDLFRMDPQAMRVEVAEAQRLIEQACGAAPKGFRAPGYGISPALLRILEELGFEYDSSVFPSPPYYAAKALIMGTMRLTGRHSGAALLDPRLAFAPRSPYVPDPGAPWRKGASSLLEVPISVAPGTRVPVIGTSLTLAPGALRKLLVASLRSDAVVNLEFHGLDLCDADMDGLSPALKARQPDLRIPLGHKRAALGHVLREVLEAGYECVPLLEVTRRLRSTLQ